MARLRMEPVTLENVRIFARNFRGAEGQYNKAGDRNFCILLPDDIAQVMEADGWNIKWLTPREEGDKPQAYVQAAVSYKGRPPRIVLVSARGKTPLLEDLVDTLDSVNITNVDVSLNPYQWDVNGREGVKAYVRTLFVTMEEDEIEKKYIDVPDSAVSSLPVTDDPDDGAPWRN